LFPRIIFNDRFATFVPATVTTQQNMFEHLDP